MTPVGLFWAPQITLPFGGNVNQKIDPETSVFFESIPPKAGDARMEKKAFEVASYGRQLGLITELLLDMATHTKPTSEKGKRALLRLSKIQEEIENIKVEKADSDMEDFIALVERIEKYNPKQLAQAKILLDQRVDCAQTT